MLTVSRRASNQRHEFLESLQTLTSASSSYKEKEEVIGKLLGAELSTVEECLLQLTHCYFTISNAALKDRLRLLVLSFVGKSFHVALRVSWVIDSVSLFWRMSGMDSLVDALLDSVESYAINQGAAVSSPNTAAVAQHPAAATSQPEEEVVEEEEVDPSVVLRKEARLKMYSDVRAFVTTLTDLSNNLRFFPDRPKRKDELRKCLRLLNEHVPRLMLLHPLGKSDDPVQWIVNIAVEECTVFSSRERAPYIIRYEVIVDRTTTLRDPAATQLRLPDGSFRVSADSDEVYAPAPPPPSEAAKAAAAAKAEGPPASPYIAKAFGESGEQRRRRVRAQSPWGAHPGWGMNCMIVKAGDDLRQEELALQLIAVFDSIWREECLTVRAKPYIALPTSSDCGLLEVVDDSNSIDGIKKQCQLTSIAQFYEQAFDGPSSVEFRMAQRAFIETMAGYSVISYILQIKDRHNGNLMVARTGELVHIDFGFLFCTSPGGLNFESAPFKLSQELIDVMGGQRSDAFGYYTILVYQALEAARARLDDIVSLVALLTSFNSMPCFGADPSAVVNQIRGRFRDDLYSEAEFAMYTKDIISNSADNWRTRRYDQFQTLQNGIL